MSGLTAQSGWALWVFGVAPTVLFLTDLMIEAVVGPEEFWNKLSPYLYNNDCRHSARPPEAIARIDTSLAHGRRLRIGRAPLPQSCHTHTGRAHPCCIVPSRYT